MLRSDVFRPKSVATGHSVKAEMFESLQTQFAFSSAGPTGKALSHYPQLGGQAPLCWASRRCCVAAGLLIFGRCCKQSLLCLVLTAFVSGTPQEELLGREV